MITITMFSYRIVDPQTYIVKADGVPLVCEPATEFVPMAQRYFLFLTSVFVRIY